MTKKRRKHSMTQEEMIADIKRVMEIVGVTDLSLIHILLLVG